VRRELARTGGSIGSAVSNDYSAISFASTRRNFDRSWEIFTDLALNPAFAPENIERARAQISTGLREQETNSDNYLQILQDRVIYAVTRMPTMSTARSKISTVFRRKT
jgi:zinc protease